MQFSALSKVSRNIIIFVFAFVLFNTAKSTVHATTGSYQLFDNGIMHSSVLGTYATWGNLYQLFKNGGGTQTYGFPMGEVFDGGVRGLCQQFESGILCEKVAPDVRTGAERAIDTRASALGSSGAGSVAELCGYAYKYYNQVIPGEDGIILYTGSQTVYSYGGTYDTYMWYSDRCDHFGIPTADPLVAGTSPYHTAGAYQDFSNGRIYWSWNYLGKFVYGTISQIFEAAGGTNSPYGFPTTETYAITENGIATRCQNFEGTGDFHRICEQVIPAKTAAQLALAARLNREVLTTDIRLMCGMETVNIDGGIAYYDPNYRNVRLITGAIYTAWGENCSAYGLPENDTTRVSGFNAAAGFAQRFHLGTTTYDFYQQDGAGVVILAGGLKTSYDNNGGLATLGFPEQSYNQGLIAAGRCGSSGYFWELGNGRIYLHGDAIWTVKANTPIGTHFFTNGADTKYGLPMNNENWSGNYFWQDFAVTRLELYYPGGVNETRDTRYCPGQEPPAPTEIQTSIKTKVESLGQTFADSSIVEVCGVSTHPIADGIVFYHSEAKRSYTIRGEVFKYWQANCGPIGLPRADTNMAATSLHGTTGQTQTFYKDTYVYDVQYSSFGGLTVLEGAMRNLYNSQGGLAVLGFVNNIQNKAAGVPCGNQEGTFWNIENGRIYLNNGTYYVAKANTGVGTMFFQLGADEKFGLPTGNEQGNGVGTYAEQKFELVTVYWTIFQGAKTDKEPTCGLFPEAVIAPTKERFGADEEVSFSIRAGLNTSFTLELATDMKYFDCGESCEGKDRYTYYVNSIGDPKLTGQETTIDSSITIGKTITLNNELKIFKHDWGMDQYDKTIYYRLKTSGLEEVTSKTGSFMKQSKEDRPVSPVSSCSDIYWSSAFGPRTYWYDGRLISDFHDGIDIARSISCPIRTVYKGIASTQWWAGNTVDVVHNSRFSTRYGHASEFTGAFPRTVETDDTIMQMGNTGLKSTGIHLHFMVFENGSYVDSVIYFGEYITNLPKLF